MKTNRERNAQREFLKDHIRLRTNFSRTDQNRRIPPPPIEKAFGAEAERVPLQAPGRWSTIQPIDITKAIENRKSCRKYLEQPLSLEELAYLLWATQGTRSANISGSAYRTVPSAGCRHAFETYLAVLNVQDLEPGIYRYLPLEHELLLEFEAERLAEQLKAAALHQSFVGKSAVTFIWTVIPYRMEWRYGPASYKVLAIDIGHVCQNLYLACSAVSAGTCAIAAYHQDRMDALLRVDGEDEFALYLAPVGKV